MKVKLNLVTISDCHGLTRALANYLNKEVYLEDGNKQRVHAVSLLGALCSLEWNEVYLCSDEELPFHLYSQWMTE